MKNIGKEILLFFHSFFPLYIMVSLFFLFSCASNPIQVVDGDDIIKKKEKIRLFGIDSPEYNQVCKDDKGDDYYCGRASTNYLKKLITKQTYCKTREIDKYGRTLAICYNNNEDINAQMVKAGWAVAYDRYSDDYLSEQQFAKKNQLGIWQGEFVKPENFRIQERRKKNGL